MKRVFAHIGFSFAVALLILNLIPIKYIIAIAAGLAVVFIASLAIQKYRQALTVPICIGTALMACLVFLCAMNSGVEPQQKLDGRSAETVFYIVDLEEIDNNGNYNYIVKTQSVNCDGAVQNIKLKVQSTVKIEADYYQKVSCDLSFYSISDDAFSSYGNWGNHIFLTSHAENIRVLDEYVHSPMRFILKLRESIIDHLYHLNQNQNGALSVALVTGYKGLFNENTAALFKYAGTSHIVAVSGFHLTVVMAVILYILKCLKIGSKPSAVILIWSVLFYCALAGFSKSVVRAGIMVIIMLLGSLFERRGDALNSLGIAVFIICLNPFAVCDIGAGLSVLAVLALITLYPCFIKVLNKVIPVHKSDAGESVLHSIKYAVYKFLSAFLLGLSVMIYSLPVLYLYFGYVGLSGLVSNVIITPIVSLAMPLSIFTFAVCKIPVLSTVFSFLTNKICGAVLSVIRFFASFKGSVLTFSHAFVLILVFILIIFAFCFILNKKKLLPYVSVFCALLLVGSMTADLVINNKTSKVLVCENHSVVVSCDGETIVYGVRDESDYYSVRQYLLSSHCKIDYLILDDNSEYAVRLMEAFDTENIVVPYFDEKLLENMHYENYIASADFEMALSDDFIFEFSKNEDTQFFVSLNTIDIFVSKQNYSSLYDINIYNHTVTDQNGVIDLKMGEIMYTIDKYGNYSVRRFD